MTVLYVLISTDPFGGATKSFLTLLQGVLKAGVNAIVVVPDTNGIYDTLREMGVKVIVVSSKGNTWTGARTLKHKILYVPRQLGRIVVNMLAHRKIEKLLSEEKIDIIHSNNTVTDLGRHLAGCRRIPQSQSISKTFLPCFISATERHMHTVDFPVPPLPEATTITSFINILPLLYSTIKTVKEQ